MPRGVRKNKTTNTVRMAVRFTFKDAAPKIIRDVEQVIAGGRFTRLIVKDFTSPYTQLVEVSMEDATGYTVVLEGGCIDE